MLGRGRAASVGAQPRRAQRTLNASHYRPHLFKPHPHTIQNEYMYIDVDIHATGEMAELDDAVAF